MPVAVSPHPLALTSLGDISMAIYSIYRLTNIVNGKVYIGKTRWDPNTRLREHVMAAASGSPNPIHRAIHKYGESQFQHEVIFNAFGERELNEAEIAFIRDYNCCLLDGGLGYNATRGGDTLDADFARANNLRKVKEGRHHFQGIAGSELSKRTNAQKIAKGQHHWQTEEHRILVAQRNRDHIENGTHPLAGVNGTIGNRRRIASGTHNLAGATGSRLQRAKLEAGVHHSQKNHECPHCGRTGGGNRFKGMHFQKCKSRP